MPRQALGYLSLPPEIRNQIMGYVLMPGDVHPCVTPFQYEEDRTLEAKRVLKSGTVTVMGSRLGLMYKAPLSSTYAVLSRLFAPLTQDLGPLKKTKPRQANQPGFQLLASCKQVYNEGHFIFYSTNTFHMPRGQLQDTLILYNTLCPEHKACMKRVQITLGIADLTPSVLEEIDIRKRTTTSYKYCHPPMLRLMTVYVRNRVWRQKLDFLRDWKSLHIGDGRTAYQFRGDDLDNIDAPNLALVLDSAVDRMRKQLTSLIGGMEWEAARTLLVKNATQSCLWTR